MEPLSLFNYSLITIKPITMLFTTYFQK